MVNELTIGELARKTGVHVETIRYFEKIGMLTTPDRTPGGHRLFDHTHLRTLRFIKRARELGFAPRDVRTLLDIGGPAEACCDEVREIAVHHLAEVRRKIADLSTLERHLAATVEQCSGGHVPECAGIDMLEGGGV